MPVDVEDIEDAHDVRMLELRLDPALTQEASLQSSAAHREVLQGVPRAEPQVTHLVDAGQPSLAEQALDLVALGQAFTYSQLSHGRSHAM